MLTDPVLADESRYLASIAKADAREAAIKERADEIINDLHEWASKRGFREWSEGMRVLAEEMAQAEFGSKQ